MSTDKKKHTNILAKAALIGGLAASTVIPGTAAIAQSKPGANASDTAIRQVANGPEEDPNMPIMPYALAGAPITWSPAGDIRIISFLKPQSAGAYLGFNEKGTWIRNESDRKVYVWNLKDRSLTLGAESDKGVPLDLRNPSNDMKGLIAIATGHANSGTKVANNNKGRNTPYIPPSVAKDGNAQSSGETSTGIFSPGTSTNGASVGTSTQVKGSAATIRAGVLTFTNEEGVTVSLKVVRPANQAFTNPNAPTPTGNAGVWIGEDPKNSENVVQIYVQDNGTVAGTIMSGMAAQAMKRMMMATPQHQ